MYYHEKGEGRERKRKEKKFTKWSTCILRITLFLKPCQLTLSLMLILGFLYN